MLSRWFHVRLKAAERALDQGRLDDAYEAARAAAPGPGAAEDARLERLRDALVRPLMSRARLNRQAGRAELALADLDRLVAIGRGTPEVQTLRQELQAALRTGADAEAERRDALARAAERLRAGRLETVRLDIQRVEDAQQRGELEQELAQRVERGQQILRQAEEALSRDDLLVAVRFWNDARQRFGHTAQTDALAGRLVAAARQALSAWHVAGKADRLLNARPAMATLAAHDPTLAEGERLVALWEHAARQLAAGDYDGLRRTVLRLKAAGGDAPWLSETLVALAQVAEGRERLYASPIGLIVGDGSLAAGPAIAASDGDARPNAAGRAGGPPERGAELAGPLLLLVDGGGSNVLVRGDRVRLGRGGSSSHVDLVLSDDLQPHHADLVRQGEDYFLTAHGPSEVNGFQVQHTLLRDGDRVKLGARLRFIFNRPTARSLSAVLRLSHRCRLPGDVGTIVLFHDTCVVGPDSTCHVRTQGVAGRAVVFERAGGLVARPSSGAAHSGRDAEPLVAARTVEFGELRLTVKTYDGSGGCRAG